MFENFSRYGSYIQSGFIPSKTYWTWNLYGFGYELKRQFAIRGPALIRVSGDHGVHLSGRPSNWELRAPGRHYFTWSKWRADLVLELSDAQVHHVPHPWLHLGDIRALDNFQPNKGLLVFLPHSTPSQTDREKPEFELDELISYVESLPQADRGVTFMYHWHDRANTSVRSLHQKGKSVVTAGDTQNPFFARRFSSVVSRYSVACSLTTGSQVFLTPIFGTDHFILPMDIIGITHSRTVKDAETEFRIRQVEAAFSYSNVGKLTFAKDRLLEEALGSDKEYTHKLRSIAFQGDSFGRSR